MVSLRRRVRLVHSLFSHDAAGESLGARSLRYATRARQPSRPRAYSTARPTPRKPSHSQVATYDTYRVGVRTGWPTSDIVPRASTWGRVSPGTEPRRLLTPFAAVEVTLKAVERRGAAAKTDALRTPGASDYGLLPLPELFLDRGLSWPPRHPASNVLNALACVVRAAEKRPLTVAALGGSITSGLAFGTLTGQDNANAGWLYHRKWAQWARAQWPRTQAEALNRTLNRGLPAVGPAFAALCLDAMLPEPFPDLVIVEYAINVQSPGPDPQWFELLLRRLLSSKSAPPAVLVLSSFKMARYDIREQCISEQRICEHGASDLAKQKPSASEADIERISLHYGVPVLSLRRAVGSALGTPPFVPSTFMRDCAHPNAQGHSWLATKWLSWIQH